MLVLRSLPLETVLEGDTGFARAALEPCVHSLTCGACLGCGCGVLRHRSYFHIGFRGSYPFLVFHGAHHGPNQAILLVLVLPKNTEQGLNSSTVFSKQTVKPRMRDKREPSSSPFCHLCMLVPRVTTNCWDIWNGFMWVHGVWIPVRGKSLILCSCPWQAAPASAWQHRHILSRVNGGGCSDWDPKLFSQ